MTPHEDEVCDVPESAAAMVMQRAPKPDVDGALRAAYHHNNHPVLAFGWEEHLSDAHGGRVYYYNPSTQERTWDRPVLMPDGTVQMMDTDTLNNLLENLPQSPSNPQVSPGASNAKRPKMGTLR